MPEGDTIKSSQETGRVVDHSAAQDSAVPVQPRPLNGWAFELLLRGSGCELVALVMAPDDGWLAFFTNHLHSIDWSPVSDAIAVHQVRVVISVAPGASVSDSDATYDAEDIVEKKLFGLMSEGSPLVAMAKKKPRHGTVVVGKFALSVIPWDRDPVEFLRSERLDLESLLNNIRQRVTEALKEREEIDARRDQWAQEKAIPLLGDMTQLLKSASLPAVASSEIDEHCQKLVQGVSHSAPAPWITETIATLTGDVPTPENPKSATPESLIDEPTPSGMIAALARLKTRLDTVSDEAEKIVQSFLDELVEATAKKEGLFPTLEEKKEFAKGLQAILKSKGLAIRTSKGESARFDAYSPGDAKDGFFRLRGAGNTTENLAIPLRPLTVCQKQFREQGT